jgi:hypothetical protein
MYKGKYGITQQSGKYSGNDFQPEPENTPLFRVIFWSLVASVIIGWLFGWLV